jgi:hypothetical protein
VRPSAEGRRPDILAVVGLLKDRDQLAEISGGAGELARWMIDVGELDQHAAAAPGLRRIKWHECRHSFASQLVTAGTPMRQVQEWMLSISVGVKTTGAPLQSSVTSVTRVGATLRQRSAFHGRRAWSGHAGEIG